MEVVGFEVDGTRYGLEPQYARIFSQKLREFARGEYAGDLAEIKRRTGLDAAEWLDGAVPLADRVDRWAAEDRDDAIALADDVQARAAYAVLSITYSDGWDARPPGCAKRCTGRSRPTLLRPGFAARATLSPHKGIEMQDQLHSSQRKRALFDGHLVRRQR